MYMYTVFVYNEFAYFLSDNKQGWALYWDGTYLHSGNSRKLAEWKTICSLEGVISTAQLNTTQLIDVRWNP